jgi:F-box domain
MWTANNMSTITNLRPTYWERPGQRQTRNSRMLLKSTCGQTQKRRRHKPKYRTRLPTEIWLLILEKMSPRDLQAVMRVNRLWYSEANKVLRNKITSLLNGKGLCTLFRLANDPMYDFLDQYTLPRTFEAKKNVVFFVKGNYLAAGLSVVSILEKEGLDGFPEGVWRDHPDFLRAYLHVQ